MAGKTWPNTFGSDWCGEYKAESVCADCSGPLPTEEYYPVGEEWSAIAQALHGRICKRCSEKYAEHTSLVD